MDPEIRKRVKNATDKTNIKDPQGKIIRHVRVKARAAGRVVKKRRNYKSKHDYKNYFYSQSDGIPLCDYAF